MNADFKKRISDRYLSLKDEADTRLSKNKNPETPLIYIGMATCCVASGSADTKKAFEEILAERKINAEIIPVGCLGHCYAEPFVIIHNPGFPPICYYEVTPGKANLLVKSFLEKGDPLFEYVLGAMEINDMVPSVMEFPRFNREKRIVMDSCGIINPGDIHHYIEKGGYSALAKAITMDPDDVIDEIKKSVLRGRGGAGFYCGTKWDMVRSSGGKRKYVICNADEGDPGAYMDRAILESNPH
ncbi:MAG: NADH-quinone oxidoreductase subunit F, partial [Spirochaetes bacterium]|nr:NADH-quinone oxidoreductase subunit F [Spirochaetota bacterium]